MYNQSNKFDQQQGYHHYMMQNQYQQMMQQDMMQQNMPQNFNSYQNSNFGNYQQQQFEQPEQVDVEKVVLDALNYYFSEVNLNKDAFFRSQMNTNGYIDVFTILSFNKISSTGITPEKLSEVLENNKTNIESYTDKDTNVLYLRNKDWDLIKDKLTSLEMIQQQKKTKKNNQNINYVNMQNNYYVQHPMSHPMSNNQMDINMMNQYMMNPQYQQQLYHYQQQMQNQMMDPNYQLMQQQMQQQQPHEEH